MVSSKSKLQSQDPWWVRWLLIGVSISFLTFLLLLPLIVIFREALAKGIAFYIRSLSDRNAWNAVKMTLLRLREQLSECIQRQLHPSS